MTERLESRTVTINDKEYRVVGKVKSSSIRAKVYDNDNNSPNTEPMVEIKESTKKWFGFRDKEMHRNLPEVMQDALTEAVEEVENKRLESEEIDQRINNMKETYE